MDGERVDGEDFKPIWKETWMQQVERVWAGFDAGKHHHHLVVIDSEGRRLLSRRVANQETELRDTIDTVLAMAMPVTWAIDLADGPAALVIMLLLTQQQQVVFLPGVAVNRASAGYRGEGKTDAKDAAVIADQARMRRDLRELHIPDGAIAELRMLTAHRADLVADRTREINRLRALLLSVFPALERVLDFTNQGPVVLISGYQTPAVLRSAGASRVERWLRKRKVRDAAKLAAAAVGAAQSQQVTMPGEAAAADLVRRLAATILHLGQELHELDHLISVRFRAQPQAATITSIDGIGDLLGAEFLAATGGGIEGFATPNHLAGYAGLAPTPRDSGSRSGNLHRPKRYNRQLQRVFYTSALISIQHSTASKAYYDRKRAEGKRHKQAILALARRRVNVLWAMLRDGQPYQERVTQRPQAA